MLTITSLTIRQFLRARSIYVVAGICLLAALFAVVPRIGISNPSARNLREAFADVLYLGLFSGTLLPLAVLVLATAAIGDEIDDRTLQYIMLKPISRTRILFEKFLAVVIVLLPIIWAGIAITWTVVAFGYFSELQDLLWPALASSLVAIFGFGALFLLVSTLVNRALLIGVFYVFVWETSLSRVLPGLKSISIRHFTQSMFVRLVDDRRITLSGASAETTVIIATICIVIVSLTLATWRLRSMSLD
jgi:ABC-2 type transport system permease protein